jgi:hypothetical protein
LGDVNPGEVKLGDGTGFLLHITKTGAMLKSPGSVLKMTKEGSVLQPGGRLSIETPHAAVDFAGKSINPLATEPSNATLLVPMLIERSPLEDQELSLLQGVVAALESLREVL